MSEERFELQREQFEKALDALRLALAQPEDEFIRDSVIKRFELSFETARKAMRQWLIEQQELTPSATKKEVMEAAFRVGLIGDADLWAEIVAARNDTAHEYNAEAAQRIVAFVRGRAVGAFDGLRQRLGSAP